MSTISGFLPTCCSSIWDVLLPQYMPVPTQEMWKDVATGFAEIWDFPTCLGSIDGKHIRIACPDNSGSLFFNYKQYFSQVLLAVADSQACFIWVDVGDYGRNSDAGVFTHSSFGGALHGNLLNIPTSSDVIRETGATSLPYVFVGDEAFPLKPQLMRPYPRRSLDKEKRVFNYRLTRARKTVEMAFGILASKFRVFQSPINLSPNTIPHVVRAACVLHDYIRKREGVLFLNTGEPSAEGSHPTDSALWSQDELNTTTTTNRSSVEALAVREKFKNYFNNSGKLEWQDSYLFE